MIDKLEGRVLFAGGTPPTLESVLVLGSPGQATGIVLTFSQPLDAVGASDVAAYDVQGVWRATPLESIGPRPLALASAEYDDATRAVTLTPNTLPFDVSRYLRQIVVDAGRITGTSGESLDGDGNGVGGDDAFRSFAGVRTGRTLTYRDASGARVRLRLTGPGRLRLLRKIDRFPWGDGVQLWVEGATPDSVLTGTVRPRRGAAPAPTPLAAVVNPGGARNDLLGNPSFHIGT
jgi:hypothetical protein